MDPNAQMQPQPQAPSMGQRSPMPPISVQSLQSVPPVTPPATTAIATPAMSSFNKEGGPMQTAPAEEDELQNVSQSFVPPVEDEQQKTNQQAVPQMETQAEIDQQRVVQQYTPLSEIHPVVVTKEAIQPSIPEVAISQELAHMVEATPQAENPFLPPELQKRGIMAAGNAVPVPTNTFGIKALPMQYQDAVVKEKTLKLQESMKWLAGKIHYYWRKLNPKVYK